jgi:SAM-dependent methyltransferase
MTARGSLEHLVELLVCPRCLGDLLLADDGFRCTSCERNFPVVDGIPVFLDDLDAAGHDELDHGADPADGHHAPDADHKHRQAEHFDRMAAEEFEIERPRGAPRLYGWLLAEKFRRSVAPIGTQLAGSTVLTVCGGSGMDAEFLADRGASVISSDISMGASRRARERARKHGVNMVPIVADVERLPFRDGSVDLVFVHDGLHHLEQPETGLREMTRVARRWVAVTEPARARLTSVAILFGWAQTAEESGNRVMRLEPDDVLGILRPQGFERLAAGRYAMYYRHQPGVVFRLMSRPGLFQLATAGWRLGNAILGRVGNKMVVVGERRH